MTPAEQRALLEPGAAEAKSGATDRVQVYEAATSIAISLKRLADAVAGNETNSGIVHAIHDLVTQGSNR